MHRFALTLVVTVALATAPTLAYAHSGGTDANGCHTDSSTGSRHCHGAGVDSETIVLALFGVAALGALAVVLVALDDSPPGTPHYDEPLEETGVRVGGWATSDSGGLGVSLDW